MVVTVEEDMSVVGEKEELSNVKSSLRLGENKREEAPSNELRRVSVYESFVVL
jgi:hypothetical protein